MSIRQQNKARARSNILEAAQTLISAQGLEQTTTRAIAKQAGVSYQTLYNYFPTKAHIVQALLADDLAAWSSAIDFTIKQYRGNLLETLVALNRIGLEQFAAEESELRQAIAWQLFIQNLRQQQPASVNQVTHERYHALLSMAQGMGQLQHNVDLHLMAHTLFCLTDYTLLRFFLAPVEDKVAVLTTMQEQLELLITPYLTA
jgi:AcrR family transcriptional regulator